jgi:hypothetical protein
MNVRAAILVLAVAVCSGAATAPKRRDIFPPYLTVEEFVVQYRGNADARKLGHNVGRSTDQRYARGYLDGVVDLSRGRSWCVPRGVELNEADEQVVSELAKMVPGLAKQALGAFPSYAGRVLLDQYIANFPVADACTSVPHLTGDELLTHQLVPPGITKWDQSLDDSYKRHYAEGYQAGVVDATQGRNWCAPSRMKPGEVDDRVWTEIKKRRGAMPGNAAIILLELYSVRFPCP